MFQWPPVGQDTWMDVKALFHQNLAEFYQCMLFLPACCACVGWLFVVLHLGKMPVWWDVVWAIPFLLFQTHIEKGNDLLEEASMLTQSGNFDEATGYKDLARTLKKHLSDFTGQLEASREKIEGTAKCYHLLDKVRQPLNLNINVTLSSETSSCKLFHLSVFLLVIPINCHIITPAIHLTPWNHLHTKHKPSEWDMGSFPSPLWFEQYTCVERKVPV